MPILVVMVEWRKLPHPVADEVGMMNHQTQARGYHNHHPAVRRWPLSLTEVRTSVTLARWGRT